MNDRDDVRESLPHELGLLLDALRSEFDTKITSLKLWGILMCLAGGTIGGLLAKLAPSQTSEAVGVVVRLLA
jgi:hypothetical protein